MRRTTKIDFLNDDETILVMEQMDPEKVLPGDISRQFIFALSSGDGRDLGNLAPGLTHGYGYSLAIAYVASALLQIFPDLQLIIHSYPSDGSPPRRAYWSKHDIKLCIHDNKVDMRELDKRP
jgi:hypothetical protein